VNRGRLRLARHSLIVAFGLGVACASAPSSLDTAAIASLPCRQVLPRSAAPLRWWSPPAVDDNARLQRWCKTVGPVVAQPKPTVAPGGPIDQLAVVTWNLHVGAGDVDGFVERLRAGEFTGGKRIEHFVLLLQEAYRRDDAIPVRVARGFPVPGRIAAARNRGPAIDHFWRDDRLAVLYAPSMRNGIVDLEREDRGNAIVSTLELADSVLIELPLEHQRRVAIASTVAGVTGAGTPWRVRVVDVHFDTALALTHGGPFAARRRQADALIAALQATAAAGDAGATTIVAGDFNTWGGRERALDALAAAFADRRDRGGEPTWFGPLGVHATLDHMFVAGTRRIDIRRVPDRFGSDHYPLLATVNF